MARHRMEPVSTHQGESPAKGHTLSHANYLIKTMNKLGQTLKFCLKDLQTSSVGMAIFLSRNRIMLRSPKSFRSLSELVTNINGLKVIYQ